MRRAMIPLLALALASFASQAAADEGSWQPRLSLYSGEFYSIAFASETTVWAAGPGGILLSEHGGASWRWTLNSPVNAIDSGGDGLHGWAVASGSAIFATSDGGETWSIQQSPAATNLNAVAAFDSERAIATGHDAGCDVCLPTYNGVALFTDDGGANWQQAQLPGKFDPYSLSVLAGSENAWLFAEECVPNAGASNGCAPRHALLASDDGGKTWQEVGNQTWLSDIHFTSPSTGWALGNQGLVRTTDGGRTWKVVRQTAQGKFVNNLTVLGDDVVVLQEGDGSNSTQQIVKSTDAGATWTNVGDAIPTLLTLRYFNEAHAVRADWDQTFQWSEDGGATWTAATVPAFAGRNLPVFDFVDATTGWFAGSKVLRTSDGGVSWQAVSDLQLDSLEFVSPTEGWASETIHQAGPWPTAILHTVNGGATWTEQVRRQGSDIARIKFVDRLNGWVWLGPDRPVLHTRDGGLTWTDQQPPGPWLAFGDASTVWSATDPGATGGAFSNVFISRDGGDSWSQVGSFQWQCGNRTFAAFGAADAWFPSSECTSDGPIFTLYRTQNGGASWQRLGSSSDSYQDLTFFSATDGLTITFACPTEGEGGCEYVILRTQDGGVTWYREAAQPVSGVGIEGYEFSDLWHGWRVDTFGLGMTPVEKQVVESYSATPPVVMPATGQGRGDDTPADAFAALAALGALLFSVGSIARLRGQHLI